MPPSQLEHLANEILLDIFDCLNLHDLLRAFHLLNERFHNLLTGRRLHVNLSSNLSVNDCHEHCRQFLPYYRSAVHSVYLSNVETCGAISLFFRHFPYIESTFPNLHTLVFVEPTKKDYAHIRALRQLPNVHLKSKKMLAQQIQPGALFDNRQLRT